MEHPPHHRRWLEIHPQHDRHKVHGGYALWHPGLSGRLIVCKAWVSRSPQDLGLACPSLPPSRTLEAEGGRGGSRGTHSGRLNAVGVTVPRQKGRRVDQAPGSRNRGGIRGHSIETEVTSQATCARDP